MPLLRSCGVFFLLFGIGAACDSPPSLPPPEVEYTGCKAVLEPGPVCVLPSNREIRLWVGAPPDTQIEIQVDGRRLDVTGEAVQNGQTFSLILPLGAKWVDVVGETQEGPAWSLSLAEPEGEQPQGHEVRRIQQKTSRDVLREVNEKTLRVFYYILARNLAAAHETLAGLKLSLKAPAESRYLVSFYITSLAESEGDYRSALAEIQKAVDVAERVKLEREHWLAQEELALLLRGVGRFREAAQLFERLRRTPHSQNSCEEAQLLTNQAWSMLLAREAGEAAFRDPTQLLERALGIWKTCKRATPEDVANVLLNLTFSHLQQDRLAQAKDLLAQALKLEPHPSLPLTTWRLDLEARISLQEGRPAEALRRFNELEELASAVGSSDDRLRAAFGEALSKEALGNRAAALETLVKAEALLDEQSLQIPIYEGRDTFMGTRQAVVSLHVELLLQVSRPMEALAIARHGRSRMLWQLERSDRLTNLTPERKARWERLLIDYQERRTALEERAKDDLKLAEDQLHHEQATRRVEAESVKKLLDEAFLVLGDPGERQGEAPPPRPGELILAYHPLRHGWVGFAADENTIAVQRFELPPEILLRPEELARRLLLPFRASIERAKRIRILPSGPLRDVDFHALPFEGDILLTSRPVVYGLDLPASIVPPRPSGRHALLVANPRDDLPGTLNEVRTVRQVLESGPRRWITEELKNAQASAQAVRGRLAAADLLHYAGHGTFSGFGGWESGLLLAENSRLTLGDLLALERVPAWVVLSGCDTGRSSTEVPVESLGLAHAFLLAGSRAVIASTRKADDRTVPEFFTDLYRQWGRQPDLAAALQRAQLAWRQRDPGADWASFRLFEP